MSVVKIQIRRIADLRTPSDLGKNLTKFNGVIIPCSCPVAEYTFIEGLNVEQFTNLIVKNMDLTGIVSEDG